MCKVFFIPLLFIGVNFIHALSPHGNKLNLSCETCHDTLHWDKIKASFNHDSIGFKLEGKHITLDCKSCHKDLVFENAIPNCSSCHIPKHKRAENFDCNACHSQDNWKTKVFNHSKTIFPLQGAHKDVSCMKCHENGFSNTSTACVSCHLEKFNQTTNPYHVASKYSKDCFKCHTSTSWKVQNFDHNKLTSFPLTGSHQKLTCTKCHTAGFVNTSKECASCHLNSFNRTSKPNHNTAGFSKNCETCHSTSGWKPSSFDHNKQTSFPLNGAHLKVKCTDCHTENYSNTSKECVSCHLAGYEKTKNPNHVKANFSKDCQNCHNTAGRSPAKFDHNKDTNFPLADGHLGVKCKTCHTDSYRGRSTACVSCHLKNFSKPTYPNHVEGKFDKNCEKCHIIKSWKATVFDHSTATSFPLKGAHAKLDCKSCHNKLFAGTSTECVDCHLKEYEATLQPAHGSMKFPKRCESCHTDKNWKETNFNHDQENFPIFSGKHKGVWKNCNECHYNESYFEQQSCIKCHEHSDKARIDKMHIQVKDYEYTNSSCKVCHPKGRKS